MAIDFAKLSDTSKIPLENIFLWYLTEPTDAYKTEKIQGTDKLMIVDGLAFRKGLLLLDDKQSKVVDLHPNSSGLPCGTTSIEELESTWHERRYTSLYDNFFEKWRVTTGFSSKYERLRPWDFSKAPDAWLEKEFPLDYQRRVIAEKYRHVNKQEYQEIMQLFDTDEDRFRAGDITLKCAFKINKFLVGMNREMHKEHMHVTGPYFHMPSQNNNVDRTLQVSGDK
jgi:hypothetical protein